MKFEIVDRHIQELIDTHTISGASIMIAQNENIIFNKNYGFINIEKGYKATNDSVYRLASNTKVITSVAALIAIDKGLFKLTDYVDTYLPYLKDFVIRDKDGNQISNIKYRLTIEQLLHHSSGIQSAEIGEKEFSSLNEDEKKDLESICKAYSHFSLSHIPGSRFEYSAFAGLDIIARIIEVTSGMKYFDFIKKYILDPCEMTSTYYDFDNVKEENHVVKYTSINGVLTPDEFYDSTFDGFAHGFNGGGAGLVSSIKDYTNFGVMLTNNGVFKGKRIVSLDMMNELIKVWSLATSFGSYDDWGLAVSIRNRPWTGIPKHSFGWSGAFGTHYWSDPDHKITVVYMHNSNNLGGAGASHTIWLEDDIGLEVKLMDELNR